MKIQFTFQKMVSTCVCLLGLCTVCFAQSPPAGMSARAAVRILEQATWGPAPAAIQELSSKGFDQWFADQLKAPISTYRNQALLDADGNLNANIIPVQQEFFRNALDGRDQLRQRVAFILSEIWVVSNYDLNNASALPPILRIFQRGAFGNYETLMKRVTMNPAMGHYLDMANNDKADPAQNTAANENYARELMQLFTLGLEQLNLDGTPVLDSNGNTIPTYTQAVVENLAKVFTGWSYAPQPRVANQGHNQIYFLRPMLPVANEHDMTAKVLFPNVTLSAGMSAEEDMDAALHAIFLQPSVAPFISKQLIQHLVTSNPSPAYVSRVATVFANDGKGVRGNLEAVVRQILIDPEARAGDSPTAPVDANFGHLREPVLLVANLLRALNGDISRTTTSYVEAAPAVIGQDLFNCASVFGYFPPNYQLPGGQLAPEMAIYSTQTAIVRTGLINAAVYAGQLDGGTTFNLTPLFDAAARLPTAEFLDLIDVMFFHKTASPALRQAMTDAMAVEWVASAKAKSALYIALTSSEYNFIH